MILVLLILLFILKFNSPAVYIDYLIGLVLLLCLASSAFTLWLRQNLHIQVDIPDIRAREGDDLEITVRVVYPEFFGRVRAAVLLKNLQRGTESLEYRELSGHRCQLRFGPLEPGTLKLSIPSLEVYGAFGVLRLKKKNAFEASINVYPKPGPSPDLHVRMSYIPGGGEIQNAKGDDYSEIYEVRPLQEGDSLRYVHRQLSAKHDEYIIKVGSDSRRPVYNYYIDEGLDFTEICHRIAQMFTLKASLDNEEGAFMAAAYKGSFFEIAFDSQLFSLVDLIYKDYLPEPKAKEGRV